MLRRVGKLAALAVSRLKKPGKYGDGGGLWLQIGPTGGKAWIFRYIVRGRERTMGLGAFATVSLAEARIAAGGCRKMLRDGVDPIANRKAVVEAARLEAAKAVTFDWCAEQYIASHRKAWKNSKHAAQWKSTLDTYCGPVFGSLPVQAVDIGLVTKVLDPIWATKTETARRVRQRVESVIDWATVKGHRKGDNPARWKGLLENVLPDPAAVSTVRHFPSLHYSEIGSFIRQLRAEEGIAARALEFAILTVARSSEVRGLVWSEIDLGNAVWVVPASRIKAKKEHRVPLSRPALSILEKMNEVRVDDFVFAGMKPGKGLSDGAMLALLGRMKHKHLTVHGFRSTFRDWAAELTDYGRDVAEMALAHAIESKVERAYRRGDLFTKRRRMMDDWAKFSAMPSVKLRRRPASNFVPIVR